MARNWLGMSAVHLALAASVAGCGGGTGAAIGDSVAVVPGPLPVSTPTPSPSPTPTPTPTATTTQQGTPTPANPASDLSKLPPVDLSDMKLWNYAGKWHASEWDSAVSTIPWRYNHVTQPNRADTYLRLDEAGAPELQAVTGTPAQTDGLWEADVTLPTLMDGLVVAPLWLYNQKTHDEIDFEYAGRKGLDVTLHANVNGAMKQTSVRLFAGKDMSGQRHRFGIRTDLAAGVIEMFFDGKSVQRWTRDKAPIFITTPLRPWFSMWAANPANAGLVGWTGTWPGLPAGGSLTMTVHGYRYTPLS